MNTTIELDKKDNKVDDGNENQWVDGIGQPLEENEDLGPDTNPKFVYIAKNDFKSNFWRIDKDEKEYI